MKVTALNNTASSLTDVRMAPIPQTFQHWTAALFVSAILGAVSGLLGLALGFLTVAGLIVPTTSLYATATLLMGVSFILFGLAAHCLDKADAADKAIRLDYCRQNGMKE